MILTATRHGRTRRDVRHLQAHLDKEVGQVARVVRVGNCPVSSADDALAYMQAMRDGSNASVACHHVTISPRSRLTDGRRDEAVRRVLAAYGADDHAFIVWEHDEKPRTAAGGSEQHFHLVVAHVGNDLKALDDGQSFTKLEAVARTLEADFGEPLTVSRRTSAVAAELRRVGRADVADRLVHPPEPPRSSMTSKSRAAAARRGVDLPGAKAAVMSAFARSDSPAAFGTALLEQGLAVVPGQKTGVYVVVAGEATVGALDRLLKLKRADVAQFMKGFDDVAEDLAYGCPQENLRPDHGREVGGGEPATAPAARPGTPAGGVSGGPPPAGPGGDFGLATAAPRARRDEVSPSGDETRGYRSPARFTVATAARLNLDLKDFSLSPKARHAVAVSRVRALAGARPHVTGSVLNSKLSPVADRFDWLLRRAEELAELVRGVLAPAPQRRPAVRRMETSAADPAAPDYAPPSPGFRF